MNDLAERREKIERRCDCIGHWPCDRCGWMADATDEMKRLREADSAKSKYIKELRAVNRALNDAQTNNLKRIEELEKEVRRTRKYGMHGEPYDENI